MKRFAFASSVTVTLALAVTPVLAQTKSAQPAKATTPTTQQASATQATTPSSQQAAAAPAKFVKPLKGTADIQFMQVGQSKKVGNDIVTVLKIKNLSNAPVSLLKVDEYWYDKGTPPKVITGDQQAYIDAFNEVFGA